MNDIKVSIIIPTYNRKDMLKGCLKSIYNQDYPGDKYEVIVVDDGSTDETGKLLSVFTKQHPNFHYYQQNNKGPAAARNLGIQYASANYVVLVDSDCLLSENFLKIVVSAIKEKKNIDAFVGSVIRYFENKFFSPISEYEKNIAESLTDIEYDKLTHHAKFHTDCCVIKKEIFEKLDGFDEKFISSAAGEDKDFGFRLLKAGYKISFLSKAIVYHFERSSIREMLKRYYNFGKWDCVNYKKHFKNLAILKFPFNRNIILAHFPITIYLDINGVKILIFLLTITIFYIKIGFFFLCLYFLSKYIKYIIFTKGRGSIKVFISQLSYLYLSEGSLLAGHVAGSIKNRIICI